MLIIFLALGLIGVLLTQSTSAFSAKLPFYQERLSTLQSDALLLLQSWEVPVDVSLLAEAFPLGSLLTFAGSALRSLGAVLSNGFLIILTVIFILAEAASFSPKLRAVLSNPDRDLAHFGRITGTMNRYIAIKTSVSVLTGILVSLFLWTLDVDFPILWGLVALLLNFIPTIGSIIAGIPPVLLALVQLGPAEAGLVVVGFFLVNTIVGNILEPRYMGQGLGLSALIVFVSLIFWGWLFGPVGMLLSVPLTMSAKIALEASPNTTWLARLLAPSHEILHCPKHQLTQMHHQTPTGTSPMSQYERPNIAAMQGYASGEQPQDQQVIKLNTNENPYPPSPKVAKALAALLRINCASILNRSGPSSGHRVPSWLGHGKRGYHPRWRRGPASGCDHLVSPDGSRLY